VTTGIGVSVIVGEFIGLGEGESVIAQLEIRELTFSNSFISNVKEYLTFIDIQFCV
jgi:hypothetical protein